MPSTEESEAQINQLKAQIYSLLGQLPNTDSFNAPKINVINEIKYEIGRMESFLRDLSQRGGTLMALSGIISLMPYTFLLDSSLFIRYYVFWIFPFLILAILAFVLSSFRKYTYQNLLKPNGTTNDDQEELIRMRQIWQETYNNYRESLVWHRISNIATQMFLFDYFLNFYIFAYYEVLNDQPLTYMATLVVVGILIYVKFQLKSKINNSNLEMATGAAPVDI
jgi:hypothetical protein